MTTGSRKAKAPATKKPATRRRTSERVPATEPSTAEPHTGEASSLGARLREARVASGLSLRETARRLSVSPSFLSQLETGKSQPSVATLFSLTRLLGVTIDQLFVPDAAAAAPVEAPDTSRSDETDAPSLQTERRRSRSDDVNRSKLGSPADAWEPAPMRGRVEVGTPGQRRTLTMDSGVIWEQLVSNTGPDLEFMDVVYTPHSGSTNDGRLVRHAGFEYGYLLEGELEITVGFDVFTLVAGQSFGFDSGMPHLFKNNTDKPARFISCIRHVLD